MGQSARERILGAIEGNGFSVVCQAIIDLDSGDIVGFESLARFSDPPLRPPDQWFHDAELVGLRRELEIAAVRAALRLIDRIPADAYLSLNISPDVATDAELTELLSRAPVERIIVEITEQIPVDDYDGLNAALAEMRQRGLRIALDDAGSGFAGMAHIVRLKPDVIKLDRSMVTEIEADESRRAFVSSLLAYANATGGSVIAEGVETAAEAESLRKLGVHWGQGYLFARPAELVPGLSAVTDPVRALVRKGGRKASRARARHILGRISVRALTAVALLSALMIPTAAMAQNALPGNPLWQVKIAMERVRLVANSDPDRRLELHLEFAARRVDELSRLLTAGGDDGLTGRVTRDLGHHLSAAREALDTLGPTSADAAARVRAEGSIQQYIRILKAGITESCAQRRVDGCEATRRALEATSHELALITNSRSEPVPVAAGPSVRPVGAAPRATTPSQAKNPSQATKLQPPLPSLKAEVPSLPVPPVGTGNSK